MSALSSQEEFLRKALPVCEGRIGLQKFTYVRSNVKSTATCLKESSHPDFQITPNKLLGGSGCPACAGNRPKGLQEVYEEIQAVHGDKYKLTAKSTYLGSSSKMELWCTECSVPFMISPKKCKAGQGHRSCSRERAAKLRAHSFEDLLARSVDRFGEGRFSYVKDTYVNFNSEMTVVCPKHGEFRATPVKHLNTSHGCPQCWESIRGKLSLPQREKSFIQMASSIHEGRYDYSNFRYVDAKTKGIIRCPEHGDFLMTPDTHTGSGCGCPKCGRRYGRAQDEVAEFMKSLGLDVQQNVELPSGLELDVAISERSLAIEYNGLRWHSDEFRDPWLHLRKTREASHNGIRLIHLFEDEWLFKKDLVKKWLSVVSGKESMRVNARECSFSEITWHEYRDFVNAHHLQGAGAAPSFSFGLFHEEKLVSVMGFSPRDCSEGSIELVRFCSDGLVRGGFSKLLKHSRKVLGSFQKIVSFSDTRWSNGDVYRSHGFVQTKFVRPDYWYVRRLHREDKRAYQRKYLPSKLEVYDEAISERDNCANNGIYRIFDCGKVRWELTL